MPAAATRATSTTRRSTIVTSRLRQRITQQERGADQQASQLDRDQRTFTCHAKLTHIINGNVHTALSTIQLSVQLLPTRETIEIQCLASETLGHIKAALAQRFHCSISQLALSLGDRELDHDYQPISEIGIGGDHPLTLVLAEGAHTGSIPDASLTR